MTKTERSGRLHVHVVRIQGAAVLLAIQLHVHGAPDGEIDLLRKRRGCSRGARLTLVRPVGSGLDGVDA